ncbi:hypothetical protein [Noviherbaspirillum sp. ST9]|uniref:hypothetical protein n=1 Tax=Noviherbaspirillum sp. ST9 TaxID=3401606 RepID=UPI003B588F4F
MPSALATIFVASSTALMDAPGVEMEKAYWDCEYAATHGQISLDVAAGCSEIYERLKKHKFGGEFGPFLAWWRENRLREFSARTPRGQSY